MTLCTVPYWATSTLLYKKLKSDFNRYLKYSLLWKNRMDTCHTAFISLSSMTLNVNTCSFTNALLGKITVLHCNISVVSNGFVSAVNYQDFTFIWKLCFFTQQPNESLFRLQFQCCPVTISIIKHRKWSLMIFKMVKAQCMKMSLNIK